MPSSASGRDQGGTDLLAQGAVDVRGDAPFPPRLIHPRVGRSEATGLSGSTLHGHGLPQRPQSAPRAPTPGTPIFARPWPGAPFCPPQRSWRSPPVPGRLRYPLPSVRGTWGDLELCNDLQNFYLPFCKSCRESCRLRWLARGWGSSRGHRLAVPNSSPAAQPLSCSHILPSSRGETHASLSRHGGLRAPGPSRGRASGSSGASTRLGPRAGRSALSTAASAAPLAPAPLRPCVRSGPAAARSLRAAGGLPPSLGELGAGPRACAASPRTPRGWGLGIGVFLSPALAPLPARPPLPPGWKASPSPWRRLRMACWAPRGPTRGA